MFTSLREKYDNDPLRIGPLIGALIGAVVAISVTIISSLLFLADSIHGGGESTYGLIVGFAIAPLAYLAGAPWSFFGLELSSRFGGLAYTVCGAILGLIINGSLCGLIVGARATRREARQGGAWRFAVLTLPVLALACVGAYYVHQWIVEHGTPSGMVRPGAFPSHVHEAPSQKSGGTALPTSSLPTPAPPSLQSIESPTQVLKSPTRAADVLPPPAGVEVGRPVNISIGESLEDLQAALGNRVLLEPSRSAEHTNAQSLTLRDGVRVFFDDSKTVYRIRIDAPFVGKLGGREIIRTREAMEDAPGTPAKQIQALSNTAGSSFISDIDASTKVRYDFDAAGKVITVFLLSGTMQIMSGS